jgi:hypothetical protein
MREKFMSSTPATIAAFAIAAALIAGCSTVPPAVIVSARHPASPDATEAPVPRASRTLAIEPVADTGETPRSSVNEHQHGRPAASNDSPAAEGQ